MFIISGCSMSQEGKGKTKGCPSRIWITLACCISTIKPAQDAPSLVSKQMIKDKTSHFGINLIQAACALGSFYKYSILEQPSQSSSSAYLALELKYSNRDKNNSPESRQHSCFHWRIITEVGLKAGIREVETLPLIPPPTPPPPTDILMTHCIIVLKKRFPNFLFPGFMVSQLLTRARLWKETEIPLGP